MVVAHYQVFATLPSLVFSLLVKVVHNVSHLFCIPLARVCTRYNSRQLTYHIYIFLYYYIYYMSFPSWFLFNIISLFYYLKMCNRAVIRQAERSARSISLKRRMPDKQAIKRSCQAHQRRQHESVGNSVLQKFSDFFLRSSMIMIFFLFLQPYLFIIK